MKLVLVAAAGGAVGAVARYVMMPAVGARLGAGFPWATAVLYQRGDFAAIAAYVTASFVMTVGALFAGLAMVPAAFA